jgi:hypothetical protein
MIVSPGLCELQNIEQWEARAALSFFLVSAIVKKAFLFILLVNKCWMRIEFMNYLILVRWAIWGSY